MKPTRRHIDDIFAEVRPVQPKAPLCSADELRAVINSNAVAGHSRSFTRFFTARTMAAAAILVVSTATGIFMSSRSDEQQNPLTMRSQQTRVTTQAETPIPQQQETPAQQQAETPTQGVTQAAKAPTVPQQKRADAQVARTTSDAPIASVVTTIGGRTPTARKRSELPALVSPLKIRGLHFLDLSDSDLERIGVTRTPHGYELAAQEIVRYDDRETRNHMTLTRSNGDNMSLEFHKNRFKEFYSTYFGGDTTEQVATLRYKISLDTFATACQPIRYPKASTMQPLASPLIISQDYYRDANDEGRLVVTFENPMLLDSISKFSRQVFEMYTSLAPESATECRDITKYSLLSKLVPVRIRMRSDDATSERASGSDIILWYYPSREFIDALPQELADQLRIELGFTTLVEEGVLHADDLKQRYCGEYSFTDVCRTKDGAISISSIVPNPASDRAMVKVHVTEQRNFTVSLHDMSGNRVAHLTNLQLIDSDIVTIDVSDKPAGTYLIAITSDKGEQVVERLIVSR